MWMVTLADLAPERAADRVADRRIDLAGDLGDGNAEGDGQVELDVERVAEADVDARLGEPEPLEQALERAAPANPVTPYDPSVAAAHDVDDGPAGDERSAGRRCGRHAGEVLLA